MEDAHIDGVYFKASEDLQFYEPIIEHIIKDHRYHWAIIHLTAERMKSQKTESKISYGFVKAETKLYWGFFLLFKVIKAHDVGERRL